jgi:RNA polymerase sigma-70 factor (ECF subfamily)
MRFSPDLVEAATKGDAQAIEELLVRARPNIRRYARQKCRNASDAEDAVQEAMFILFRKVEGLRKVESLSAWLFTVVYRICIGIPKRMVGIVVDVDEVDASGELRSMPVEELRLDLANAIQSLPPHYREVVILRDIEELTVNEIAAALNTTRETIKARLHRARVLLREYLIDTET